MPTMRGDASETLTIRLLRELELQLGDTRLSPLESGRAESLLAYLLLHRDAPQARSKLAYVLWPESSEAQSRTNLRHLLHTLRRTLPDADRFLEITPRTMRWLPDERVRSDVATFEAALDRADDDGEAALRQAIDAYTGDLLEGHYDEWILDERERLRRRYLDAVGRLASLLADRGAISEAILWAERLVAADPLCEAAHRLLMRLFDARGERARALRVYHACCETLERRLGTEPSTETRGVYEELVRSREQEPPAGAADARSFVGRIGERARLHEIWTASERGRAQLLVLTGDAGVGKTRLLEELRAWCERRGVATAEARSYPAEGALAYAPVVTWLRSAPLMARVRRLEDGQRADLARLLPELGRPASVALPTAEQRRRLFDVLAQTIAAPGPPLLLLDDDAHWADADSLQLLHYLMRRRPGAQLLVAATARTGEFDEPHPLRELIVGLKEREQCVELELTSLSRHETRVLAERLEAAASAVPPRTRSSSAPRATRCSSSRRCAPAPRAATPSSAPACRRRSSRGWRGCRSPRESWRASPRPSGASSRSTWWRGRARRPRTSSWRRSTSCGDGGSSGNAGRMRTTSPTTA